MKKKLLHFILIFSLNSFSQTKNFSVVVSDTLNIPLESANIIAKPLQENAQLKFAIADNKGRYRLELEQNVKYEITVSYIGFVQEVIIVEANSSVTSHNFKLKATGEKLKEIVIKYEYKPIEIKKDTMTFTVSAFVNGNERKMKEVLEKLPGVEVDKKGGITVQGKKVTKILVDGKTFFGGGTKLAVENIPADALDKIEVIDHFNEVKFMKKVSDSDELVMNVKLKADKKKFVFGDVELGAEVANDNGYHYAHTGLFYYAPKLNVSFIGDANNIGKSTFTFEDLMRFEGGVSSYLTGRKSLSNLYGFTNDNTDVVGNKSQFGALNFSFDTSPKLAVSGYSLFSKVFMQSEIENKNIYLQNNGVSFENRTQSQGTQSQLGIVNIKLDYTANKNQRLFYNAQFQSSTNNINNIINSVTNLNATAFETITNADNVALKQFIEWHKSYNDKHSTTLVVNQAYEKNVPQNRWFSNQLFLPGLIPLQPDTVINIDQIQKLQNNSVDVLLKHYWILNNFNHLYTNIGNNYIQSNYQTSEKQNLSNGTINDFASAGFGNDIQYKLNDAYVGLEYKFKIGKLMTKPALYLHFYQLQTYQSGTDNTIIKTLLQPQLNSEYEFNNSEKLTFNYKLANTFPEVQMMGNQFQLQSYNSVFVGNSLLENEQFHALNLRYSKMNMYRGVVWFASAGFNKKVKTTRNEIQINGINQVTKPILTDNPETNWRLNGSVSKKIYRFELKLNTDLSWFKYIQNLNNSITKNDRNNQNMGFVFRTYYKKWPEISIGYNKGFSQFSGITQSKFESDNLTADLEFSIMKHFTFKFDNQYQKNKNNLNQINFYNIANTSIRYEKKNSPFGFELFANNLFNYNLKNDFNFSDFMISETRTFVMPRVVMLSLSYKL